MLPGDEVNCFACKSGDPCILHPRVADKESVNHPAHYGGANSIYEHVKVAEALGWVGNAFIYNTTRYLWRHGKKDPTKTIEDLQKAKWYLEREIARLQDARK